MADRFYHPGPWENECELAESEAHHLLHVLRAEVGTEIEIFDGRGHAAKARVIDKTRRSARLEVLQPLPLDKPVSPRILLAAAPPKGDRLRWLVEKITELGVDEFIPLTTARSVVIPSEVKLHKLEQTITGACKQSGRNTLLQVRDLCALGDLPTQLEPDVRLLFGRRAPAVPLSQMIDSLRHCPSVLAIIGPEGGLTAQEEEALLARGAQAVSLGMHILRVETAATAFASWLCGMRGNECGVSDRL